MGEDDVEVEGGSRTFRALEWPGKRLAGARVIGSGALKSRLQFGANFPVLGP